MKPVYMVACVKNITAPWEHVQLVVKIFTLSENPLAINILHFYIFILHILFKKINLHIYCMWLHMCMWRSENNL